MSISWVKMDKNLPRPKLIVASCMLAGRFFFFLVSLNNSGIFQPHLPLNVIKLGCNYILSTYLPGTYWEFAFVIAPSTRCALLICRIAINKTCLQVLPTGNQQGITPLNHLTLWLERSSLFYFFLSVGLSVGPSLSNQIVSGLVSHSKTNKPSISSNLKCWSVLEQCQWTFPCSLCVSFPQGVSSVNDQLLNDRRFKSKSLKISSGGKFELRRICDDETDIFGIWLDPRISPWGKCFFEAVY